VAEKTSEANVSNLMPETAPGLLWNTPANWDQGAVPDANQFFQFAIVGSTLGGTPSVVGVANVTSDIRGTFPAPTVTSEGVPKVTQEAAACGLAQVIFGYYEAPTVRDGQTGYVVWDDNQFINRVGDLLADLTVAHAMGRRGVEMAEAWDWDRVAPLWERKVLDLIVGPSAQSE
jgi:hypothetical protein